MRQTALILVLAGLAVAAAPAASATPEKWLAELQEQIKGREKEPAKDVFKNVQLMKEMPAERLLRVMQMGYSPALGVACDHCHTPGSWEDDGKAPKLITREMMTMTGRINRELLANLETIKERQPVISCSTCHRGQLKPALTVNPPKP